MSRLATALGLGAGRYTAGGVSYTPWLDDVSSKLLAGFGGQRLITGVTDAFNVRRSSDSTEQAVGTLASGLFDAASYASFIGGGSGYASAAYDHKAANDLLQTTAGNQPEIIASVFGSIPSLKFTSNQYMVTGDITNTIGLGDFEFWCLFKPSTVTGTRSLMATTGYHPILYLSAPGASAKMSYWDNSIGIKAFNTTLTTGTTYLARLYRDASTVRCDLNGVTESNSYTFNHATAGNLTNPLKLVIGSDEVASSSNPYLGEIGLALVFKELLTSGEATTLTNTIAAAVGATWGP